MKTDRLCTMDLRALNHVLTHSTDYQKPSQARFNLSRLLGNGCLAFLPPVRNSADTTHNQVSLLLRERNTNNRCDFCQTARLKFRSCYLFQRRIMVSFSQVPNKVYRLTPQTEPIFWSLFDP